MSYLISPHRKSWIDVPVGSDFPLQNIPFGIMETAQGQRSVATRVGDTVVDLAAVAQMGYLDALQVPVEVFYHPYLNGMMLLGRDACRAIRMRVADLLDADNAELRDHAFNRSNVLYGVEEVTMQLPVFIGDYTDFYSSREHATNVGKMFRDPDNALLPNWLHLPVGYHGRSSSIVVSGTPLHRPFGQTLPPQADTPVFGPSKRVDFELETGFFTYEGKPLGHAISAAEAEDYIFGMVLFNDWSARDIQKWEYVPLGPFLAKNFGSSMSPWVVTLDALEPFRTAGPTQEPAPLPYLHTPGEHTFDIQLEVLLQPEGAEPSRICRSNFKHLYWNMAQQLAHHTVNGCNIRAGDLLASGTISGPTPDSFGSMLELSWSGQQPLTLASGHQRSFIEDGDTVIMRGFAEQPGLRIGFGEVSCTLLPALPPSHASTL
jgi:fumarylacetoacetase